VAIAAGEVVCCDLDGVLWRAAEAIPGAADAVMALRAAGARVAFLTNNSHPTPEQNARKLSEMGVEASPDDVLSSAQAAAALLVRALSPGARVLGGGGPGVLDALSAAGFTPVELADPAHEDVAAVVVGWHAFDFDGLDRMSAAVRAGARFVATNLDPTYPTPDGLRPGSGAIVAAVATAAGRAPDVAGKPREATVALVRDRFGARGVVVGDRPSTDGALAEALGWPFALVLSGVTRRHPGPGEEAIPDPPPAFVAEDLAALAPMLLGQSKS